MRLRKEEHGTDEELTTKRIRLWIEVDVHPELLLPAASRMSEAMWNSPVEDLTSGDPPLEVQAFFEAILGSTPGPHPDWLYTEGAGINYGGEILRTADEDPIANQDGTVRRASS